MIENRSNLDPTFPGPFKHQVHVDKNFVGIVGSGALLNLAPKLLLSHANVGDERRLLKVSTRQCAVGRCQSNEERSPFGHTSIFEQNASGSKALPLSQGGRAASFEGLSIYEVAF